MANQNPLEVDVKFHAYLGGDRKKPENKRNYTATVVFANTEDAAKCGSKWVIWELQRKARKGDFPEDRKVRVDSAGNFEKTTEEVIKSLPAHQLEAIYAIMEKRMRAEMEAKMSSYNTPENEDLTEEELEELEALTTPDQEKEPVQKPAHKKANSRR